MPHGCFFLVPTQGKNATGCKPVYQSNDNTVENRSFGGRSRRPGGHPARSVIGTPHGEPPPTLVRFDLAGLQPPNHIACWPISSSKSHAYDNHLLGRQVDRSGPPPAGGSVRTRWRPVGSSWGRQSRLTSPVRAGESRAWSWPTRSLCEKAMGSASSRNSNIPSKTGWNSYFWSAVAIGSTSNWSMARRAGLRPGTPNLSRKQA